MNANVPGGPAKLPSGRHDLPRDAVVESQRDRILQAMAETIGDRGYPAATVGEVVQRAGVSSATFYEHFRGKDDCLLAGANAFLGEIITIVTTQYSPDKPIFQVVRDAVAALLTLLAHKPAYAKFTFLRARGTTPAAKQVYDSGVNILLSLLDQLRVDGPADARTPASTARGAVGAAEALIREKIAAGETERLPEILPDLTYGVLVPFLGQEQALELSRDAAENPPQIEITTFGRAHL